MGSLAASRPAGTTLVIKASGMRFSLRTLLIAATVGPPLIAGVYFLLMYAAKMSVTSVSLTLTMFVMVGRLVVLFLERFPKRR